MKKSTFLPLLMLLASFSFSFAEVSNPFYYYQGEPIYLNLDRNKLIVGFEAGTSQEELSAILATESSIDPIDPSAMLPEPFNLLICSFNILQSDEMVAEVLENLEQFPKITFANPSFKYPDNSALEVGLGENFIVKLLSGTSMEAFNELMTQTGTEVANLYPFDDDVFILKANKNATGNAMEMANLFHESGLFAFAEPDFLVGNAQACLTEPDYPMQWYLENMGYHPNPADPSGGISTAVGEDINVACAWDAGYTGFGIRVAILDDGIQQGHPDLLNTDPGYDPNGPNGYFPPITIGGGFVYSHGTSVAGIVAAECNNFGPTGIAYDATLVPVKMAFGTGLIVQSYQAASVDWAWGPGACDILNMSYGTPPSALVDAAMVNAITQGRNGLGSIIVASTHNQNQFGISYPASSPFTIAVGSMDHLGARSNNAFWGSNYGPELDLVAPGEHIVTTDLDGDFGYNWSGAPAGLIAQDEFVYDWLGTSAACPVVAGVLALMLEANGNLLPEQIVRKDLLTSCRKLSQYQFATTTGYPYGTWNLEVGYGCVDACAALGITPDPCFPHPGASPAPAPPQGSIAVASPCRTAGNDHLQPHIFPNPTQHRFMIEWPDELGTDAQIELFDLGGKRVLQTTAHNNFQSIKVGELEAGYYMLRFTSPAKVWTSKLVITD